MMMLGNVTGPKVMTPALLFALLSPGMLLELPAKVPFLNKNAIATMSTSRQAVLFHALVFVIVYKLVAMQMGLVLKPNDIIVPTILFMLLSPGMLLTIPGKSGLVNIQSGGTSIAAVLVHTLVFALVFALLRKQFPSYY